jgi:DMATS type aromatic prenyltransferase
MGSFLSSLAAEDPAAMAVPAPPSDPDARFWWDHFAPFLASFLTASGCYTERDVTAQLTRLRDAVIPCFGPASVVQHALKPTGSPFELSWNFTPNSNTVRYTFQPMGDKAGSAEDPFGCSNLDRVLPLVERASAGVDLGWLRQFKDSWMMHTRKDADTVKAALKMAADAKAKIPCQLFLGYDLVGSQAQLKAYFMPVYLHVVTGRPTLEIATEMIRSLVPFGSDMLDAQARQLEEVLGPGCPYEYFVDMVAIDCCDPARARIKVYARVDNVSRACVKYFITRGGRLTDGVTQDMLRHVDSIWHRVIDEGGSRDGLDERQNKAPKDSDTFHKGVVMAFTLSPALKDGEVRVRPYCPWSNYQKSDARAVESFAAILAELNMPGADATYLRGIRRAASSVYVPLYSREYIN